MLSRAAISAPHDGQRERPWTNDSPRGSRYATTLRKLPITQPSTNRAIATRGHQPTYRQRRKPNRSA